MPIKDIAGLKFGRLVAVQVARVEARLGAFWLCRCDCGAAHIARGNHLRTGITKSCGCQRGLSTAARCTTHGAARRGAHAAEYRSWAHAKNRCLNPTNAAFERYGGRGIRFSEAWKNDFAAFYAHIGPRPSPSHSLDRIENDGHYEPGNVRWATKHEQSLNRRPRRMA